METEMTEERRIFGQRPQTVKLALRNLPDETHPIFHRDLSIQHLAALREILTQSILHYLDISPFPIPMFPPSLVENKMIPLTDEDVGLMERYSFCRSGLVGVGLFQPQETEEGHILNALISDKDRTAWISAWRVAPWDIADFPLILIESHESEDPMFPFIMGVLTPEEYSCLPQEVDHVLYDLACERAARRRLNNMMGVLEGG